MFEHSEKLDALARQIIDKYPEFAGLRDALDGELCIVCMTSGKRKRSGRKITFADCEKVSDKLKAVSDVDFIITFYADSEDMDDRQREILMRHELRHIGFRNGKCSIVPHDLEDFRDIIDEYGVDWNSKQE